MTSPKAITIGIVIILLEIFLLINAEAVFPGQGSQVKDVLMLYLILQATVLAAFAVELPILRLAPDALLLTAVGFIATLFLTSIIPEFIFGAFEPVAFQEVLTVISLGFLLLYTGIKALIEEVIFRGILMPRIGLLAQSVLFGVFHLAVLSAFGASALAIAFSMVVLIALGYLWGILAQRGTILVSWGSHWAWNIMAAGIGGLLIGV